jgi:hypothetical protein
MAVVIQREFQPGRVYLGWQQALVHPDPGPPPRRPVPPLPQQLSLGWLAAQRREEDRLARPARLMAAGCLTFAAVAGGLGASGLLAAPFSIVLAGVLAGLGTRAAWSAWRGERLLAEAVAAEQQRVATARAAQERRLAAWQEEHARRFRDWQRRRDAYARQAHWYGVAVPDEIDRVDIAGGTLPGWTAILTTIAAPRLAAGGEITVLDLTEGAVAADLLAAARASGISPLVWVLPADLPRLDLGVGLPGAALASVLSLSAGAAWQEPPPELAQDTAILQRLLDVLGDGAGIAGVMAGLRALAQAGDPRADLDRGLLSAAQLRSVTALYGRAAADRVVTQRAFLLEARLRELEPLGSAAVPLPASRLRVLALDRKASLTGMRVLGTYLTVALTHLLRQVPAGDRWRHTLCVAGADRLDAEVLDRLCHACETSHTGLVLGYRHLPAPVRERLGRGNAAVVFMRLGNADDARAASEQIGTEHRFVVSQLTDTIGTSVTGTTGDSYTSTVSLAGSAALSSSATLTAGRSQGRGRSHPGLAPFAPRTRSGSREASASRAVTGSGSWTEGITTTTSWGTSTSRALSENESLARTTQRSREFLVEARELQRLPVTAAIISYPSPSGHEVVLADVNPAILGLPAVTTAGLAEAVRSATATAGEPASGPAVGEPGTGGAQTGGDAARFPPGRRVTPVRWRGGAWQPPPNLGPPPEPLDWRHR